MRATSWQASWRRMQAHWTAGPGNQGSIVAALLSLLGAVLVCSCCGLTAIAASPGPAMAHGSRFLATSTPTPNYGSTEVVGTPTNGTPGTATPTTPIVTSPTSILPPPTVPLVTSPTASPTSILPTPTRSTTPGATPTATPTATKPASPTIPTPTLPVGLPTATSTTPGGTPTATPIPVPTPTPSGPAVLGGQQSAFVAAYGQPTGDSNPSAGRFQFQPTAATSIGLLIVQVDITDAQAVRDRAYSITAQPPTGQVWSRSQAQQICGAFLPADRRFEGSVPVPNGKFPDGEDRIYKSPALAATFPASAFVDGAQNRVSPGTFDVLYTYVSQGNSGQIQSCKLQIGKQQAPVAVTGNG